MFHQITSFLSKYRIALLVASLISFLFFCYSVIFLGVEWWFFSFIFIFMFVISYLSYEKEVKQSNRTRSIVDYFAKLFISLSLLIVLLGIYVISFSMIIGLLIPIAFIWIRNRMNYDDKENFIRKKEKNIFLVSMISIFLCLYFFSLVPTFIANNNSNPKDSFSNNYQAVNSYLIYGEGLYDQEHIIAQSWYRNSSEYYYNDYINVIYSNKVANNNRGNLVFGEVEKNNENAIYDGDVIVGYRTAEYFMPLDEYKGDVARIVIYMYVTYKDDAFDTSYVDIDLMKKWSRIDPVDQREMDRNNEIYQTYHYRNKYVESPWLVKFVFD